MNRYHRNHNACKDDGGNEKYGVNGMVIGMAMGNGYCYRSIGYG